MFSSSLAEDGRQPVDTAHFLRDGLGGGGGGWELEMTAHSCPFQPPSGAGASTAHSCCMIDVAAPALASSPTCVSGERRHVYLKHVCDT